MSSFNTAIGNGYNHRGAAPTRVPIFRHEEDCEEEIPNIELLEYDDILSCITIGVNPEMFTESELEVLNDELYLALGHNGEKFGNDILLEHSDICAYSIEYKYANEASWYNNHDLKWMASEVSDIIRKAVLAASVRHALNQPLD